jgi:hypothetical protein
MEEISLFTNKLKMDLNNLIVFGQEMLRDKVSCLKRGANESTIYMLISKGLRNAYPEYTIPIGKKMPCGYVESSSGVYFAVKVEKSKGKKRMFNRK